VDLNVNLVHGIDAGCCADKTSGKKKTAKAKIIFFMLEIVQPRM